MMIQWKLDTKITEQPSPREEKKIRWVLSQLAAWKVFKPQGRGEVFLNWGDETGVQETKTEFSGQNIREDIVAQRKLHASERISLESSARNWAGYTWKETTWGYGKIRKQQPDRVALNPVIPATQGAEVRRITVWGKNSYQDSFSTHS
jgi:hypothetical protein